jgi:hypothetical protein
MHSPVSNIDISLIKEAYAVGNLRTTEGLEAKFACIFSLGIIGRGILMRTPSFINGHYL